MGGTLNRALPGAIVLITAVVVSAPSAGAAEPAEAWKRVPAVPEIQGKVKKRFLHDVEASRKAGLRARVFSKVGDSNTQLSGVMYGLGCEKARLGGRRSLAAVIHRYRQVELENENGIPGCGPGNSFTRRSAAVRSGTTSNWSMVQISKLGSGPLGGAPSDCGPGETPLTCELRISRPRFVFVGTGSNDIGIDLRFGLVPATHVGERLAPVIRTIRRFGAVPVLSTIPPIPRAAPAWRFVGDTNREIWSLSRRLRVPMINLYRALVAPGMVNFGIGQDNAHLGIFGETDYNRVEVPGPDTLRNSVDFRSEALRYGANRRNLIWLKTLRRLDRVLRRG